MMVKLSSIFKGNKQERKLEWRWKAFAISGHSCKITETEEEAIEWCENYAKHHPEQLCTYQKVVGCKF